MRDIYEIVQNEIFANINNEIKVESVESVISNTQNVYFCKNKWIRVNQSIKNALNIEFKVISIANDGKVTLKLPNGHLGINKREIFTIKEPIFLFGTKTNANNDYKLKGANSMLKLPLCWLVESITETEYSQTTSKERDSVLRFYFLDDNNPTQYKTNDYRLNVVSPMLALKDEVKRVMENNTLFELPDSYAIRTITRFGNENERGAFENVLDENLSGVEMTVTLPINKSGNFNCKC